MNTEEAVINFVLGFGGMDKLCYTDQFSILSPGTAERSLSVVTTVQLPKLRAIAAMRMSMVCIGCLLRRSVAYNLPYSFAASVVKGHIRKSPT